MDIKSILPKDVVKFLRKRKRDREIRREAALTEDEYPEYLEKWYERVTHRKLDLKNPVTYCEKQQWLKLYDQNPLKTQLADKYAVRDYVDKILGGGYTIPKISVGGKDCWTDANEIDFDKLPNQFVMKCNHGSGYNIIVKDKSALNKRKVAKIKKQLNVWLKEDFCYTCGLELQYKEIKHLIYIEEYMAINDDLPDYKFMCFSGEVKYVWVDTGRYVNHRRSVFDLDFKPMPFKLHTYEPVLLKDKPENFDKMIEIAKKLCGSWKFVRVDLYNIGGKIYFGELTFSSGSGIEQVHPEKYGKVLGDLIKLNG